MPARSARHIAFCIMCVLAAPPAQGQSVVPGARVRIVTSAPRATLVVGELVGLTTDGATIRSLQPDSSHAAVEWVLGEHQRLEMSTGMRSNWLRGAGGGLLFGGALGALVASAAYEEPKCGAGCLLDFGREFEVAGGAVLGGLSGLVLGALIGSGSTHESWTSFDNRRIGLRITPSPQSGVRLTTSMRF